MSYIVKYIDRTRWTHYEVFHNLEAAKKFAGSDRVYELVGIFEFGKQVL